jgi:hypothetical protein
MNRKNIIGLVVLLILLQSSVVVATTNRMRVLGDGGLVGIVSDDMTDIKLNSAQLAQINQNKLLMDFQIKSAENNNQFLLAPRIVFPGQQSNTVGVYADINSYENQNDLISFRLAHAVEYSNQLTIGGRVGMVDGESESEIVLAGGFIHQVNPDLTIDGSVGVNHGRQLKNNLYRDNNNLFLRSRKEINNNESVVGLIDLNFNDQDQYNSQKLAIGKNESYKHSFLSYGLDFFNTEGYTKIDFNWGAETDLTDKITLRMGRKHRLYAQNETESKLSTPIFNYVNAGLTYNYTSQTKLDIAYSPYMQLGDDATTDINISLTTIF